MNIDTQILFVHARFVQPSVTTVLEAIASSWFCAVQNLLRRRAHHRVCELSLPNAALKLGPLRIGYGAEEADVGVELVNHIYSQVLRYTDNTHPQLQQRRSYYSWLKRLLLQQPERSHDIQSLTAHLSHLIVAPCALLPGSEFLSIGYEEVFSGNQGPFDEYIEGALWQSEVALFRAYLQNSYHITNLSV